MVGVGVLAGSIVMLLTVGWAGSLYAGRCDLSGPEGTAKDRTLTKPSDFSGTGVTTDEQTRCGKFTMPTELDRLRNKKMSKCCWSLSMERLN